jgi:hypothetical protein
MPTVPRGKGLPTNLINDVLVTRDGTLFVATTLGVAESRDGGRTFTYSRGADWGAKVRGLYGGPPPGWTETPGAIYLEDYVTCLAEGADGLLWVGYRTKGWEAIDPRTGERPVITSAKGDEMASAMLVNGGKTYVGLYTGGLIAPEEGRGLAVASDEAPRDVPPLPSSAKPPTVEELSALRRRLEASAAWDGAAVYLGEDWATGGDWTGRYGWFMAVLCAANSPVDHTIGWGEPYIVRGMIGPHMAEGDGLRRWLHGYRSDNPRSLWNPMTGYRRQAEWDDHGESYPITHEGPDIWVNFSLPEGTYALSFYFLNKDGEAGTSRWRDYIVRLKTYEKDLSAAHFVPALASARVMDFRGGVYKRFVVRGPGIHWAQIQRNGSYNTICSGVFIDRLAGPLRATDTFPRAMMGGVVYAPPRTPELARPVPELEEASKLWEDLSNAAALAGSQVAGAMGLLAYRTATAASTEDALLANWRWRLCLWTREDRELFLDTVTRAWERLADLNPQLREKHERH